MATRFIGLLYDMIFGYFCVENAGEIPLGIDELPLVRIDRAAKVGEEHPLSLKIESDTNSRHQMDKQNLGSRALLEIRID